LPRKHAFEEGGRKKDLLLKEVDHRIKNSLQIVSGLLHLQAKQRTTPDYVMVHPLR